MCSLISRRPLPANTLGSYCRPPRKPHRKMHAMQNQTMKRSDDDKSKPKPKPKPSKPSVGKNERAEYERVRALEERGLFDFEVVCPTPLPTAAVVVVDPFSSGSILAARVLHYKLRLVMVFSEVGKQKAS